MAEETVVEKDLTQIYEQHLTNSEGETPPEKSPEEHLEDDSSDDKHPEEQQPVPIFTLDDGTGVTAEDAKKGYLRQSDYTKKQQELARDREEVEYLRTAIGKALPHIEKTLPDIYKYLTTPNAEFPESVQTFDDPLQQELHTLKQRLDAKDQSEQRKEILRKVEAGFEKIKSDLDPDFSPDDRNSVINFMHKNNVGDPVVAWKAANHERVKAQAKKDAVAELEAKTKQAKEEALKNADNSNNNRSATKISRDASIEEKMKAYDIYWK